MRIFRIDRNLKKFKSGFFFLRVTCEIKGKFRGKFAMETK